MKKHFKVSALSFFLTLCLLVVNMSFPVSSASEEIIPADKIEIADKPINTTVTEEIAPIDIHSLNQNECMISEYVNAEDFNNSKHIKRLPYEEELDTYVFLNENGTKSVYYMDENVKFIDKNGAVKEKDISLVDKTDGYGIVRNEFDLHIPHEPKNGVDVSYGGYNVKIIPQSTVNNVTAQKANDCVVYNGFFGANTSLKYTPMLSGVKEDVILNTYIPNTSFVFTLETDGLLLYNTDGDYYLAESENGERLFSLGKVLVYDAIGKPEYGTMTVETVKAGEEYRLTLTVSDEYLTDPTTVYPVTIDPTLTVSDTATGDGAIEDVILFSGRPTKNYGDYVYLSIGYVDSTYGIGRVAVKLPGLYNSAEYAAVDADYIASVKFYCWDTSGNGAQYINLYNISGPAWNENETYWGRALMCNTSTNYGASMSSSAWTAFDITALARNWKTGALIPDLGFMLVNSNETSASYKKAPYSSEYSNSTYRPYVVMTYNAGITINSTGFQLAEGGTRTLSATTTPAGQAVSWSSYNSNIATVDSNGKVTALKAGITTIRALYTDSDGVTHMAQCAICVYIPSGIYYFNNMSNNYRLQLSSQYAYTENSPLGILNTGTSEPTQRWRFFKLTHLGSGIYSIRSMLDNRMGWTDKGSLSVFSTTIGTSSSTVPSSAKWRILYDGNGYYFYSYSNGTSKTITCPTDTTTDNKVRLQAYSASNALQHWTITKMTTAYHGVTIKTKTPDLVIGDSFDFDAGVYSTYASMFGQNGIVWSVTNGTGSASIDSSGCLTGGSAGTVTVTATYTYSSATQWRASCTVHIIPLPDGVYYIKNREKGGYIQIDDDSLDNYSESGVHMEHHDFDGEDYQKWQFIHISNGFYKIQSVKSGLCLAVPSDGIDDSDVDIVQEAYSALSRKQWTVVPTTDGAFKIRNRAVTTDLVLCANAGTSTGTNIQQDDYVDNTSYLDEWSIHKVAYAYSIGGEFNDGEDVIDATNSWMKCGYSSDYNITPTATDLNASVLNSAVVYFSTHGAQHFLTLPDDTYLSDGLMILQNDTTAISDFSLSNAKLYVYDACSTASYEDGTTKNLCTETIAAGVECVIGWTETIHSGDAKKWQTHFQEKLINGETVINAANYANTFPYEYNSAIKSWRIYGTADLIVNQHNVSTVDSIEDSSLIQTNIIYSFHNEETLKIILQNQFDDFSDTTAEITITYTNFEKTNYVIDYYYLYNNFKTNSGYSIIVKNGIITDIRDNTKHNILSTDKSVRNLNSTEPIISNEFEQKAIAEARNAVLRINNNYIITDQRTDKYYDITTNKYYYKILSEYMTPEGAFGTLLTTCEL